MRAASALVASTLLLVAGCSSVGDGGPAHRSAALRRLLVGAGDVTLPGYTATAPAGEDQPHTAIAVRYFNRAGFTDSGLHSSQVASQLSVTLVATTSGAAARAASTAALSTATAGLRGSTRSGAVGVGSHGRQLTGRAKGDGVLQTSVFFVEGSVAVGVTLSSSTSGGPASLVIAVARAQDAKLRAA